MSAIELLQRGIDSYAVYQDERGEINDPLMGQPTQYGTPYHAFGRAVLAEKGSPKNRADNLRRSIQAVHVALDLVSDTSRSATVSSVSRIDGSVVARLNHRDFFWPPILQTFLILKHIAPSEAAKVGERIRAVQVPDAFRSRPPANWAAVWLSGEWLRVREGLSPYTMEDIDAWLAPFFEVHISIPGGYYQEPGHPNSYDLFTRYHLTLMLVEGYDGEYKSQIEDWLLPGVRRSLAVQLSDGSLASAYRSTGQTWTLGCQMAYLTMAANLLSARGEEEWAKRARAAIRLSQASFALWQRPDGPYSPVQNLLPWSYRVGYEDYTADAHYANLALGFLARAVSDGYNEEPATSCDRTPSVWVEGDPFCRAVLHNGRYTAALNGCANEHYDGFGLVDVTFGPGRYLQWASSTHHLSAPEHWYNMGLAAREAPGPEPLMVLAQLDPRPIGGYEQVGDCAVRLTSRVKGVPFRVFSDVQVDGEGVHASEELEGGQLYSTLLIPYLRDCGLGYETQVTVERQPNDTVIHLQLGEEKVRIVAEGATEHVMVLPYGYDNRRGLCGLIRIDLQERGASAAWHIAVDE